ncbi:hypothetical protein [Acutalibacter caecimuris]|uniref:hypothetical protein n=1 Tax=Acutalibacter caecimuris TaxID=3093657 RepID=UPI002AC9740D|nr:hypothetical protein [Acutalibacter sp. M00118]
MANWKKIGKTAQTRAQRAAHRLKEKNRRIAAANRLRTVIRCQERAAEKEYLALGRYYYNALRNPDNPIAEAHCAHIDQIQALRDSALESLEQTMWEHNDAKEASSIAVISGADRPTPALVTKLAKPGTLFHFNKGPIEITVTKDEDAPFDPEDENSEEVDLSDVASFDHDPMPETTEVPLPATRPAELDENDSLPFE